MKHLLIGRFYDGLEIKTQNKKDSKKGKPNIFRFQPLNFTEYSKNF